MFERGSRKERFPLWYLNIIAKHYYTYKKDLLWSFLILKYEILDMNNLFLYYVNFSDQKITLQHQKMNSLKIYARITCLNYETMSNKILSRSIKVYYRYFEIRNWCWSEYINELKTNKWTIFAIIMRGHQKVT